MDEENALLILFVLLNEDDERERSMQVHPINRRRKRKGEFYTLVQDLKFFDGLFFEYFRMSRETYDFLLDVLKQEMKEPNPKCLMKPCARAVRKTYAISFVCTTTTTARLHGKTE